MKFGKEIEIKYNNIFISKNYKNEKFILNLIYNFNN